MNHFSAANKPSFQCRQLQQVCFQRNSQLPFLVQAYDIGQDKSDIQPDKQGNNNKNQWGFYL